MARRTVSKLPSAADYPKTVAVSVLRSRFLVFYTQSDIKKQFSRQDMC